MKFKPAWAIEAFVQSELQINDNRVMSVMSLKVIFMGEEVISKDIIEAWVSAHTQNCVLLVTEVHPFMIPEELL